jgi:hypothetical protein
MSIQSEQKTCLWRHSFLSDVVEKHGEHPVTATYGSGTWSPHQANSSFNLNHNLQSSFVYNNEKSIIIERIAVY